MLTMITTLLQRYLFSPQAQTMGGTESFFHWYYYGLGGLGGWLIFFLLALAAVIWLLYDSGKRRLPATGWKLGVILFALLLLPTILYRFTVTPIHFDLYTVVHDTYIVDGICPFDYINLNFSGLQYTTCDDLLASLPPLTPYGEWIFYLGLLGGILAPVMAVGYYVTYKGLVGCANGHEYPKELGQCPECERLNPKPQPVSIRPQPVPQPRPEPVAPSRRKVSNAWLVDRSKNHQHPLFEGMTKIGRSDADIVINDAAMSRPHAAIKQDRGRFILSDIGSSYGTFLNGNKLDTPQVLEDGDEITLGNTVLIFKSTD